MFGGSSSSNAGGSAVEAASATTKAMQDTMDRFHQNPSEATGMSDAELARRRKEAATPRRVTLPPSPQTLDAAANATKVEGTATAAAATGAKVVEIKSSARAQQVMTQGVDSVQRNKRRQEIANKMTIVKKARWGVVAVSIGVFYYAVTEFLLPQYQIVQQRNRRMEMRREMTLAARQQAQMAAQQMLPEQQKK